MSKKRGRIDRGEPNDVDDVTQQVSYAQRAKRFSMYNWPIQPRSGQSLLCDGLPSASGVPFPPTNISSQDRPLGMSGKSGTHVIHPFAALTSVHNHCDRQHLDSLVHERPAPTFGTSKDCLPARSIGRRYNPSGGPLLGITPTNAANQVTHTKHERTPKHVTSSSASPHIGCDRKQPVGKANSNVHLSPQHSLLATQLMRRGRPTHVTISAASSHIDCERQQPIGTVDSDVQFPQQHSFSALGRNVPSEVSNASLSALHNNYVPSEYVDIGDCCNKCGYYDAFFWLDERLKSNGTKTHPVYNGCCSGGKAHLPPEPDPPAYFTNAVTDRSYLDNIRAYNQMFAMTSFGAKIDDRIYDGHGPYVFKLSGQVYHWIGSLCPIDNSCPRFMQLYIYDTQHEVDNRMQHFVKAGENKNLERTIVESLIEQLDRHNELIHLFRTARDKCLTDDIPDFKIALYNRPGIRRYDLPSSDCIGAIIFDSGDTTCSEYDVVIELKDARPQRINKLHPCYMVLQFPLLFLYGQRGYDTDLKIKTSLLGNQVKRMTMNDYYSYQLHFRQNSFNFMFKCGRLFQQYLVSVYCCIEQNRIDFLRANQADIRREYLSGVYDAISRGDRDGFDVGSRVILPSSFTGGPRYMYSHYLDALAICRSLGNPQYFITFTCNVHLPEIKRYMSGFPELTPNDRADIISRVFQQKIQQFIKFLQERKPFGTVTGVLYTVEFQKRGLPHCHTLLWLDNTAK